MAEMMITTGSGNGGYGAKVDKNNRLHTQSTTETTKSRASEKERGYVINTGVINLSNAADTPCLYLKSTETNNIHIDKVRVSCGDSTGGVDADEIVVTIIRNPTTGTIITSTPTNADMNTNDHFGSSATLSADVFKGATGDTMTDGADCDKEFLLHGQHIDIDVDYVLDKGSSIGVKVDPTTGNSDMNVLVEIDLHVDDPEDD